MTSPSSTSDARGVVSFDALGVPGTIAAALERGGISSPFPIQAATIPDALAGRDIAGEAPTGSGKTIAFGVPLAAKVVPAKPKRPTALVLAPTRELALQIAKEIRPLAQSVGASVHAFHGGVRFEPQLRALRQGVEICVACPGRLADLIQQGEVSLADVQFVVIDEADRMADMGFLPEVRRLLAMTSSERQTLLFSATLDGEVEVLVRDFQTKPARHSIAVERGPVVHHSWKVPESQRTELAAEILREASSSIVFCRTRHGADRLARRLSQAGIGAVAIHGGRSQSQRNRALADFKSGSATALIATDVAARGIHVDDVACVLQYDLPGDHKDYLHRSGRTGRAGATGVVVTFVLPNQRKDAISMGRSAKIDLEPREPAVGSLEFTPGPVRPVRAQPTDHAEAEQRPRRNGPRRGPRPEGAERPRRNGPRPQGRPAGKAGAPKAGARKAGAPTAGAPKGGFKKKTGGRPAGAGGHKAR